MNGTTLRGIDFGRIWQMSGATNFFEEGWPYHKILGPIGLSFKGSTFVAKTTTLLPRPGNMPLKPNSTSPKELIPKCIYVNPLKGIVLNAVGLSGPGVEWLLDLQKWQKRTSPFFISFMSVEDTAEKRFAEFQKFLDVLQIELRHPCNHNLRNNLGLQLNFSCPNTDCDPAELIGEIIRFLDAARILGIPIVPKLGPGISVEAAREIARHDACDALCVFNTVPWGKLPEYFDWKELFGSDVSPLIKRGLKQPGGLSGRPLLQYTYDWLRGARHVGITKPINAGGGILCKDDAKYLFEGGASSVSIGSIAMLAPHRVQSVIKYVNSF